MTDLLFPFRCLEDEPKTADAERALPRGVGAGGDGRTVSKGSRPARLTRGEEGRGEVPCVGKGTNTSRVSPQRGACRSASEETPETARAWLLLPNLKRSGPRKKNSKCKKSRQSKNPFLSFTLEVGYLLSSLVKVNVFGSGPAAPRALSTSHRTFATSEQTWVSLTSGLPSKSATARASVAGACLLPVAEGDFRVAIRRGSGTRLFLFLRTYRTDPCFRCTRGVVSCDGFPPRSNLDRCRYDPVTSFAWPYRNSEARQPQPALGSQMRHF